VHSLLPELPASLYRASEVRELDRRAIQDYGIPGIDLMNRAGEAAYRLLCARWPRSRRIVAVCGGGNNGGDGFVVARLARQQGREVQVLQLQSASALKGDAARAFEDCMSAGVKCSRFHAEPLCEADLIVDALLGIGLDRDVAGEYRAAIDAINATDHPILAIDIPSGLNADTGRVMGAAVRAEATMTFIGVKRGLLTGEGRDVSGELYFDDLGVPPEVYNGVASSVRRLRLADLQGVLPARKASAHKGDFGRILIVGGNEGMAGACILAAMAAYRAGAGHITVATRPMHVAPVVAACPEALVYGITDSPSLLPLLESADVVAIGPGLGRDAWARGLFSAALDARRPLVVDADALNLLALDPTNRADWVLTPHPGEAARLLGESTSAIQADRFAAVEQLVARYGGTCVLKGSGSLVNDDGEVALCDRGTPAMASAGMGDVLTGVIAAFMGQGLPRTAAARASVLLHAVAGEAAASGGAISVRASDLLSPIATQVGEFRAHGSR